jgi:ferric-dicitrate binding protein FerR (iron transport regulator)
LKEGKVRLHFDGRKHEDIVMSPEDIVSVGQNDSVSISKIQPDNYSAWIHQKLVLRDAHLSEILNYLEDNYSKKFILSDTTMLNRRIDGTLMLDNLDDALFVLSKILRVKVQKNDSTIYFIKM